MQRAHCHGQRAVSSSSNLAQPGGPLISSYSPALCSSSVSWGYHQLSDSKQQKSILYQARRGKVWNPGVINKVASFLEAVRQNLGGAFLPSFWWWLPILDVSWLVDTSLWSLSPSPHGSLPWSVSKFPSSYQNSSHWMRANSNLVWGFPGWGRSPGKGNGNPLQYACLGNPMGRGAWRATVYKVAKGLDTA